MAHPLGTSAQAHCPGVALLQLLSSRKFCSGVSLKIPLPSGSPFDFLADQFLGVHVAWGHSGRLKVEMTTMGMVQGRNAPRRRERAGLIVRVNLKMGRRTHAP